ncbi:MAG: hypothetical protein IT534_12825 [Bauldia sp.]|nr:hypothetical protein [Bauldia sp.]
MQDGAIAAAAPPTPGFAGRCRIEHDGRPEPFSIEELARKVRRLLDEGG